MEDITIIDDFMPIPEAYRDMAIRQEFKSYDFGHCVFHGIAVTEVAPLLAVMASRVPWFVPHLSFFRRSPLNQKEPNDIHTDIDMGDVTAILYLNENPPMEDGTCFWRNIETGAVSSNTPHEYSARGHDRSQWEVRHFVKANFNRLLIFDSSLFHSRAIVENWGTGDEARLTQVVFGKAGPHDH